MSRILVCIALLSVGVCYGKLQQPSFMQNLTKEAKKEFGSIIDDPSLTLPGQHKKVLEWAKKNNVEKEVIEFEKVNITEARAEHRKNVDEAIKQLPDLYAKLKGIEDSETLTMQEMNDQTKALLKSISREARKMLKAIGVRYFRVKKNKLKTSSSAVSSESSEEKKKKAKKAGKKSSSSSSSSQSSSSEELKQVGPVKKL